MANPFDLEEWLATQKKGFGGKVSREVFIAKLKELGAEIEDKRQLLAKREKEKQALEDKLKTSQTELTNRDQIIKEKDKEITEFKTSAEQTKQELTAKLTEQEKVLHSKDNQIENLQKRPDITGEKYQELLNNQEKHRPEELRPENLPADWEQQLSDQKIIEKNLADTEKKFLVLEEKLSAEQKNFSQLEAKLTEAEKRPTAEELKKAVQKETEKFKDYDNLKTELAKVRKELQNKGHELKENVISEAEYQKLNQQLQTEKEKNKVLAEKLNDLPPPTVQLGKDKEVIIKEVGKLLTDTINSLRIEIAELLKKQSNGLTNNSSTELPTDYKEAKEAKEEALRILKLVGSKIEK